MAAGGYAAVFVAVLTRSPLVEFDWRLALWQPYKQWPQMRGALDILVVAGQRGPTATAALAWLGWRSWRSRNPRPLLVFLTALVLLNVSVGAVKLATGRLGPRYAHAIGSTELFRGGDIFPSGHTANSVVIWGTLAYLASRHRKAAVVLAALAAVVVGLTTVYLGTHWFSDALGGWAAGALVLLALPYCEPFVERVGVWVARLRASPSVDPVPWPVLPGTAAVAGMPVDRGRGVRGGLMVATSLLSSAAAMVAFRRRVWNERGPPRVPDTSKMPHCVRCVPSASGMNAGAMPTAPTSGCLRRESRGGHREPVLDNGDHQCQFMF